MPPNYPLTPDLTSDDLLREEQLVLLRKKVGDLETELFRGPPPGVSVEERRRRMSSSIKRILSKGP